MHPLSPTTVEPAGLSVADTSHVIGVGRTTVHTMIKDGRLKAIKIGRRTIVLKSSLDELLASARRVEPKADETEE